MRMLNMERDSLTYFSSDRSLPLMCPELNISKKFTQIISNLLIIVALVVCWVFFRFGLAFFFF